MAEPHWKSLMKPFVLSEHAARDELLKSAPSDALRGAADGRRRLSRRIHKEAKIGQTPADNNSGRCCIIHHESQIVYSHSN